jgi:hypothetical protein
LKCQGLPHTHRKYNNHTHRKYENPVPHLLQSQQCQQHSHQLYMKVDLRSRPPQWTHPPHPLYPACRSG